MLTYISQLSASNSQMSERTIETNPRGIPHAPFVVNTHPISCIIFVLISELVQCRRAHWRTRRGSREHAETVPRSHCVRLSQTIQKLPATSWSIAGSIATWNLTCRSGGRPLTRRSLTLRKHLEWCDSSRNEEWVVSFVLVAHV